MWCRSPPQLRITGIAAGRPGSGCEQRDSWGIYVCDRNRRGHGDRRGARGADAAIRGGRSAQEGAGIPGHWSGPSGGDYKVIELWESPAAYQAWVDGTIKPNLPPGVQLADPEFIDMALAVEPG